LARRGCRRPGERGREHRVQVGPQPVEQPGLIPRGTLVVTGDRAQFGGQLAVRDQRLEPGMRVQGQQAGDAGVLRVVLLAGRPAPAGDQVGVDRDHGEPGIHQGLHKQSVAGLDDHPDLGRVGLEPADAAQQRGDRCRVVVDPDDLDHPLVGSTQGDEVELPGPVDANAKHQASSQRWAGSVEARRRADGQSSRDDTLLGVEASGVGLRGAVFYESSGDDHQQRSRRPRAMPGKIATSASAE
jgi:hypothetical protein